MRKVLSVTLFVFLIAACTGSVEKKEEKAEDERNQLIMQYLQGIWVDDNTGLPMLKIKNDSIFLASQVNAPFCFSISGDTLQAKSSEQTTYRIVKIEEHVFQFYTSLGDLVSLHKSDTDTIPFGYQPVAKPEKKVIEKDSVFYFQGKRYRGYAYINPSTKKVFRPTVTEEGMIVDNVYYDNIIHICVYQGKQCLYAKDIEKEMYLFLKSDRDRIQTCNRLIRSQLLYSVELRDPLFASNLKSDRDRIQTCNRLIRSQLLYSVELRGLLFLFDGCKGRDFF